MTVILYLQKFSKFRHHLWAASSGVVFPTLFNTALGRKESNSFVADAVVPRVFLLPLHRWVTAVTAAGTGALCLAWQLPRCGNGRKVDSKLADVVLEVRLLPPNPWATALFSSGVAGI